MYPDIVIVSTLVHLMQKYFLLAYVIVQHLHKSMRFKQKSEPLKGRCTNNFLPKETKSCIKRKE